MLHTIFQYLNEGFNKNKHPLYKERLTLLRKLKKSIIDNQADLYIAATKDFGQRSETETQIIEILPCIQSIDYSIKHLKKWMKPESRHTSWLYLPGINHIFYQPKGVIGIIVPWNYPIFLSLGPLIAALSAGNYCMIKMSEFTPNTNKVIKHIIDTTLKNKVAIVEGEIDVAIEFSQLPFAHLLYTGSTQVGKSVMAAASKNLTPVTLELGGKSPLVITEDIDIQSVAQKIIFGKLTNAGQTCIGIDYLLLPKNKLNDCIESIQAAFNIFYQDQTTFNEYTSILNQRHLARLTHYIDEAKNKGAKIIRCENVLFNTETSLENRLMPLTLIVDAPLDCLVWQEEIFGPILPIHCVDNLDQAIEFINERPHPLAIYLFSNDKHAHYKIKTQTHSGGICINDSLLHVAQDDLPFGGIGPSGMGSYHAIEGFKTFSHAKSIHKKWRFSSSILAYPQHRHGLLKRILNYILN
ncbi:coniferyl aldehyde dehydrogenase [Marinicellulosiphila megalodicopiae]|uniref:coniferyl aldehyde dehydrogenase n=1 Tax=Marinicellulosiphila megalodicopiae TaxID=2724896 RepID=UPI003BB08BC8